MFTSKTESIPSDGYLCPPHLMLHNVWLGWVDRGLGLVVEVVWWLDLMNLGVFSYFHDSTTQGGN